MNKILLNLTFWCLLVFTSCRHPPKETPVEIDDQGRVLKTFNGSLTKCYDTLGRMIEMYGLVNYDDWTGCVHDYMYYDVKGNEIRRKSYNFTEEDTNCIIIDSLDYIETINFYNIDGRFIKYETYMPIYSNNKVIGHKKYEPK